MRWEFCPLFGQIKICGGPRCVYANASSDTILPPCAKVPQELRAPTHVYTKLR